MDPSKLPEAVRSQVGRPIIVCLCGSTRFRKEFEQINYEQTMMGKIVLSVGCFTNDAQSEHKATEEQKVMLDELHKRKIDLADEVFVINPGGYIGESLKSEIQYAFHHSKKITSMEEISAEVLD